ncbi:MAG: ribonuclease III [Planctomycetota bacterium]
MSDSPPALETESVARDADPDATAAHTDAAGLDLPVVPLDAAQMEAEALLAELGEDRIAQIEAAVGHTFTDRTLVARAFVHASFAEDRLHSNERMEFLGDAVLGMIACEMIYAMYPRHLEGEMTKIKSTAVSRRTCARLAKDAGLARHLVLGKGMQGGDALPPSLAAAVIESVVASLYLDGGYSAARAFLEPLLRPVIERAEESGHQQNFKSVLQQHAQQTHGVTPTYHVLDEKGPDHAKCFFVGVELNGERYEATWGQSKKQAEQLAALTALRAIGLIEDTGSDGECRIVDLPAAEAEQVGDGVAESVTEDVELSE